MATYCIIPLLASTTDQTLTVDLDGVSYILRILWNERGGYFALSVSGADDVALLTNIKMVKNFPLIGRFANPGLPVGDLYLMQESGTADAPGYDDLSGAFQLYYITPDITLESAPLLDEPDAPKLGSVWDAGETVFDAGAGWDA